MTITDRPEKEGGYAIVGMNSTEDVRNAQTALSQAREGGVANTGLAIGVELQVGGRHSGLERDCGQGSEGTAEGVACYDDRVGRPGGKLTLDSCDDIAGHEIVSFEEAKVDLGGTDVSDSNRLEGGQYDLEVCRGTVR